MSLSKTYGKTFVTLYSENIFCGFCYNFATRSVLFLKRILEKRYPRTQSSLNLPNKSDCGKRFPLSISIFFKVHILHVSLALGDCSCNSGFTSLLVSSYLNKTFKRDLGFQRKLHDRLKKYHTCRQITCMKGFITKKQHDTLFLN